MCSHTPSALPANPACTHALSVQPASHRGGTYPCHHSPQSTQSLQNHWGPPCHRLPRTAFVRSRETRFHQPSIQPFPPTSLVSPHLPHSSLHSLSLFSSPALNFSPLPSFLYIEKHQIPLFYKVLIQWIPTIYPSFQWTLTIYPNIYLSVFVPNKNNSLCTRSCGTNGQYDFVNCLLSHLQQILSSYYLPDLIMFNFYSMD